MANRHVHTFLRQVRGRLAARQGGETTDAELVKRFLTCRDEDAFELLVWRHERMVFRTCHRILNDVQDAEDAFQAAFLALAHKLDSLGRHEAVAGWLHRVACRAAFTIRAVRAKWARRERQVEDLEELAGPDAGADRGLPRDVQALLTQEIARLPERYRACVVLCYLEGKTHEEAARQLACPKGTVASRLARARERLRARLAGRGIALATGAVAVALCEAGATSAAPNALVSSTCQAAKALALGTVPADLASPRAVTLSKGVLKAMYLTRWVRGAACAALLAVVLGLGVSPLVYAAWAAGAGGTPAAPEAAGGKESRQTGPKELQFRDPVTEVVASPDGAFFATLSYRRPKEQGKEKIGEASQSTVLLKERELFATLTVWDTRTGREKLSTGELKDPRIHRFAFSPDGKTLAVTMERPLSEGVQTDKVELWDVATGQLRKRVELDHGRSLSGLAFSPDGKWLAVSGGEGGSKTGGGARLVGTETGELKQLLKIDDLVVGKLAFSPDGKTLAGAAGAPAESGKIVFWDTETGKLGKSLDTDSQVLRSLAFSPDGKQLAAGSGDGKLRLWDLKTREAQSLTSASEWTDHLAFSPDGKHLAAFGTVKKDGKRGGEVKLWDVRTRELLRTWDGAGGLVGFTRDGTRLIVLDGTRNIAFRAVAR
jgi:RNA polymerase sigma factor (sigma-70 family)